jgi:uncharacterized membrane protein
MDGWFSREFWQVFWASLVPLTELRGSIPLGIGLYHLSPLPTLISAVAGNLIPVVVILLVLDPLTNWLRRRSVTLNRWLSWLFAHTYHKHSASFDRWGSLALMIFVAIPLPMTGGWTGALVAYVFGIRFWYALSSIGLGVLIAGAIVTAITLGGVWAFSH